MALFGCKIDFRNPIHFKIKQSFILPFGYEHKLVFIKSIVARYSDGFWHAQMKSNVYLLFNAFIPGRVLSTRYSSIAPPPVETKMFSGRLLGR